MSKREPSKCREWERERRGRLKACFTTLARLLPGHEETTEPSKLETLQRAATHIEELRRRNKELSLGVEEPICSSKSAQREEVRRLRERARRLSARAEQLAGLLRAAGLRVPPPPSSPAARGPPRLWSGRVTQERADQLRRQHEQQQQQQQQHAAEIGVQQQPVNANSTPTNPAASVKKKRKRKSTSLVERKKMSLSNTTSATGVGSLAALLVPVMPRVQLVPAGAAPLLVVQRGPARGLPTLRPKGASSPPPRPKIPIPALGPPRRPPARKRPRKPPTTAPSAGRVKLKSPPAKPPQPATVKTVAPEHTPASVPPPPPPKSPPPASTPVPAVSAPNPTATATASVSHSIDALCGPGGVHTTNSNNLHPPSNNTTTTTTTTTTTATNINSDTDVLHLNPKKESVEKLDVEAKAEAACEPAPAPETQAQHQDQHEPELSNDLFASLAVGCGGAGAGGVGAQHAECLSPTAAFLLAFPLVSSLTGAGRVTEVLAPPPDETRQSTPTTLLQIGVPTAPAVAPEPKPPPCLYDRRGDASNPFADLTQPGPVSAAKQPPPQPPQPQRAPVNWMTSPDVRPPPTDLYLPPFGDLYGGGAEHEVAPFSWSPGKLAPVTAAVAPAPAALPTLVGDLALGPSAGGPEPPGFLSVSALLVEPGASTSTNVTRQSSFRSRHRDKGRTRATYTAEALIGNHNHHHHIGQHQHSSGQYQQHQEQQQHSHNYHQQHQQQQQQQYHTSLEPLPHQVYAPPPAAGPYSQQQPQPQQRQVAKHSQVDHHSQQHHQQQHRSNGKSQSYSSAYIPPLLAPTSDLAPANTDFSALFTATVSAAAPEAPYTAAERASRRLGARRFEPDPPPPPDLSYLPPTSGAMDSPMLNDEFHPPSFSTAPPPPSQPASSLTSFNLSAIFPEMNKSAPYVSPWSTASAPAPTSKSSNRGQGRLNHQARDQQGLAYQGDGVGRGGPQPHQQQLDAWGPSSQTRGPFPGLLPQRSATSSYLFSFSGP